MSAAKTVLVLTLVGMVLLIGAPFVVDGGVWFARRCLRLKLDPKRVQTVQVAAIRLSDRTEYMVVAGTVVGILSAVYFHATEFVEHEDEPLWSLLLLHLLPSVWINAGMLYHFGQACVQNAGVPPTATIEGGGRKCRQCGGPQPPACWHCSTCNQCVMHMDHHCPFTANCVGQSNYPFFFGFVLWAWMATVYACWLSFHPAAHCEQAIFSLFLVLFRAAGSCLRRDRSGGLTTAHHQRPLKVRACVRSVQTQAAPCVVAGSHTRRCRLWGDKPSIVRIYFSC